jgi:parvulin-like peptidyl-prolyl isomerase
LFKRFRQQHIQQELLVQAVKASYKAEQITSIQKQIDGHYDTDVLPKLLKAKGYASPIELERELQKHGSSIDILRTANRNQELARQYLAVKAKNEQGFDVPDIRAYYLQHREDYAIVAQTRWEEIQLKFSRHGGPQKARKKADEILKRLDDGELFAVVAKECSDGPTKSNGGLWGWTKQGNIKAKDLDKALFEQPVGQIGPPIETEDAIEIIRVIDRTDAGYQRFQDVQEDIKSHLKNDQFHRRVNELIKELTEKATIEEFDENL